MDGRAFLRSARRLLGAPCEENWRSAVSRAYDALLHECQSALLRWGFTKPAGEQLHQFVRTRFGFSVHADLKPTGLALDRLAQVRNEADYQLAQPGNFASATVALGLVQSATDAITLLDATEADPVRRAAVIAALRTRWP